MVRQRAANPQTATAVRRFESYRLRHAIMLAGNKRPLRVCLLSKLALFVGGEGMTTGRQSTPTLVAFPISGGLRSGR